MNQDLRRNLRLVAAVSIALVSLLIAVQLLRSYSGQSNDSTSPDDRRPVEVEVARVEKTTLHPSLDLVGQIIAIPERTAVVSSQAGGWISSIAVVEGQSIDAGDTLLKLDARLPESNLLRAQATLAEKQATLAKLKRGNLPEEITAARQARRGAQANVDSLRAELAALDDLLNRKEISKLQYETKQKALEAAEATLGSADANLKLMEQGTRPEMIAEAQAQVDGAAADVKAAQLAVDWCTVRSPIDGVVVQLSARQGQFIDRAVPLATITDLSQVFAQFQIPSDALANVPIGTPVDVRVTAFLKETFAGKVSRRSGEANPLSGDLTMFVAVNNQDGRLRPGLACQGQVALPPIADALAVPTAAIADHNGQAVVTAIHNGKASETEVTVGTQADGLVQILSGLSPGELVATKGGYGLPDGYPVEAVGVGSAAEKK